MGRNLSPSLSPVSLLRRPVMCFVVPEDNGLWPMFLHCCLQSAFDIIWLIQLYKIDHAVLSIYVSV